MATKLLRTKLADIQYVPSSTGSVYANPSGKKSFIRGFTIHNTNTTDEVVELYFVPDSSGSLGTATAAHRFWKQTLVADATHFPEVPYCITLTDANDSIQAKTTTGSKVTIIVHGDQEG